MKDWTKATMPDIKQEFTRGYHNGGDWDEDAFPRAYQLIEQLEDEREVLQNLVDAYDEYYAAGANDFLRYSQADKRLQRARVALNMVKERRETL